MEPFYLFLIAVGLVALIVFLTIITILLLANVGAFFTAPPQGATTFINRGNSLRSIWPNVGGFRMSNAEDLDGRHWLVPVNPKNPDGSTRSDADKEKNVLDSLFYKALPGTLWFQKFLWKQFGVRFISFFWPQNHVHTFDIRSRKRLKEGSDVESSTSLKSRIVESKDPHGGATPTVVDSLLFLVPRPVYVDGIQLAGDNSRVNLLLLPIYRQVIPSLPVYYLKGDFFTQLEAAVETLVVDFFATHRVAVDPETKLFAVDTYDPGNTSNYVSDFLTYSHWLKLAKGSDSPLERHMRSLNMNQKYYNDMEASGGKDELLAYVDTLSPGLADGASPATARIIASGLIARFGFALVSFRIVDWEPHESTVPLAEALLAKETEFHKAEGTRQQAYGTRDSILARAEGESARYKKLLEALIANNVDPTLAARVVDTQLRTENIRDSKVTTYVEGGDHRASVMIPG